jgi:hypothetical protein
VAHGSRLFAIGKGEERRERLLFTLSLEDAAPEWRALPASSHDELSRAAFVVARPDIKSSSRSQRWCLALVSGPRGDSWPPAPGGAGDRRVVLGRPL